MTTIKQPCSACIGRGKTSGTRVRDTVRGDRTEWCDRCDGDGYVNVPADLWGSTEIAIHTAKGAAQ